MDHYVDVAAAVVNHLGIQKAIHIGHSTSGREVIHYITRHGKDRISKAALISAVTPIMVKSENNNSKGLSQSVFDDMQAKLASNRAQFYYNVPEGPFYGYNRSNAKPSEGIIRNWWRNGMMSSAKAQYDCIVALSQTDFTEYLKGVTIPVLVMHSVDDQIVPYESSGPLAAKLLPNGTLKTYNWFPHGIPTTNADTINADLLAFIKS